ncbi:MAG: vitamin B12 dependent-methionine synthase activation domain-containing protein [Prevotella sp.]
MYNSILHYDQLGINLSEIYRQMGYGDQLPGEDVQAEVSALIQQIRPLLKARFCFFISKGTHSVSSHALQVMGKDFAIGRIISAQLRGSGAYALFVATAGEEYEEFQQQLKRQGDMVRVFIADAIGSVIAEKAADCMEERLQQEISPYGWRHTNRFSPGYCGWNVSQQQLLFPLFGTPAPCGVSLTPSSLMQPVKSVSGIIGVGQNVRKLEYTCGLCNFKDCYKRKKRITNYE